MSIGTPDASTPPLILDVTDIDTRHSTSFAAFVNTMFILIGLYVPKIDGVKFGDARL